MDDKLRINRNDNAVNRQFLKILLGVGSSKNFTQDGTIELNLKHDTIPFSYRIIHKENDFRELTIIHPRSQLAVVNFYRTYQHLILLYTNQSQFSIRRPHRVAKYTFFKDQLHLDKFADIKDEIIEQNDIEIESLKTYFVYKKYSNIHKFYESYLYHRCEKRFNNLFRFDISKCFDSIYTHSISWATLEKEIVKKYLSSKVGGKTFADEFDKLMQKMNYNETNGIVIGPEFSRIFSEIILQRVDENVRKELEESKIYFKKDYEIFRYVDDYFVFYNNEEDLEKIRTYFRICLKHYKLSLNEAKSIYYKKPLITEITIAKQKISDLLNNVLKYEIEEVVSENDTAENESKVKGSIYVDSNILITKFKTIIYESGIEYKDILNYSLAILEKKLGQLIKTYFKIIKYENTEEHFVRTLLEILDFTFFIYSVSPRVNTTIKLCRILRLVSETLHLKDQFNFDLKHLVFKKIYDNITITLRKNKTVKHAQVETLYLLIALQELGNRYWLTEEVLASYLGIIDNGNGFEVQGELNYFTIVVSLFYMKNKKRFTKLRDFVITKVLEKFQTVDHNFRVKTAELIFLLLDMLAYPYVNIDQHKRALLNLYEVKDHNLQTAMINNKQNWFTNWSDFDFGKELDAKQGQEVY